MLKDFVIWWAQQWLDLLPQRIAATGRWRSALIIDLSPVQDAGGSLLFTLIRRLHGTENAIGQFEPDESGLVAIRRACRARGRRLDLLLRLPRGTLLEHHFAIPLAAEHDATQVLRYEIDRVTPFNADDVFWTWSLERRDRERGRLLVRLSLVSRTAVQAVLTRLSASGLAPQSIEAVADNGAYRHLPIADDTGTGGGLRHKLVRLAAIACILLAFVATALPFAFQQFEILRVQHKVALLRSRVAEATALRGQIAGQAAGADIIASARIETGDALQALATVTDVLSDSTFLTALTMSQRVLSLSGQSADPAGLIAAMSADPAISGPSFSAPVTAAPGGKGSMFSIRATLAN